MMEMEWIWASTPVQEFGGDGGSWIRLSEWEILVGPCPNDFGPTCDAARSDIDHIDHGMFEHPVGQVECKARQYHEHPHIACGVDVGGRFWDERRVLQVRKWKAPKSELFVAKDGTWESLGEVEDFSIQ